MVCLVSYSTDFLSLKENSMKYQETHLGTSFVVWLAHITLTVMSSNRYTSKITITSLWLDKIKEVYFLVNTQSNLLQKKRSFRYSKEKKLRTLQVEQLS